MKEDRNMFRSSFIMTLTETPVGVGVSGTACWRPG